MGYCVTRARGPPALLSRWSIDQHASRLESRQPKTKRGVGGTTAPLGTTTLSLGRAIEIATEDARGLTLTGAYRLDGVIQKAE
jgi:hypothetical protein